MKTAVCTIIAKNYLPCARVLMASVRKWAPELGRIVILVDRVDGYFDPTMEDFDLITSEDLDLPQSKWFHFKYSIMELSTAVKPYALEFLFRRYELDRLIYLDPDIKIYGSLNPLLDAVGQHSVLLTPHLTDPLDDNLHPSELDILRSGTYNLGFIGLSSGPETMRFLKWWQAKLYDHCLVDLHRGLFVDQRWVDLVPGLFSGVGINREPGYNVAYWNLKTRKVHRVDDGFVANEHPLCFFHFSGFDPNNPMEFSRHQNRFRLSDLDEGAGFLVSEYRQDLLAHGYDQCKSWPYAFGTFDNGLPIPDMGRSTHHESAEIVDRVKDPFSDEGFQAYLDVWNHPIVGTNGERSGVTRLAYRIYRARSDVQALMPDIFGADRLRFLEWALSKGKSELGLDEVFLTPAWDALQAVRRHQTRSEEPPAAADDPQTSESPEIPPRIREMLLTAGKNGVWLSPQPLGAGSINALNELIETGSAGLRLTRLARAIYESRPDLQRYLPDPCGRDGVKFLVWILTYGKKDFGLNEACLAPLRGQWDAVVGSLDSIRLRTWYRVVLLGLDTSIRLRTLKEKTAARLRFAKAAWYLRRYSLTPSAPPLKQENPSERHEASKAIEPPPQELGLNLIGYLRSEMGVGESARLATLAVRKAGLPVHLKTVDGQGPYFTRDLRAGSTSEEFPHDFNLFYVNADQASVIAHALGPHFYQDKYNIGFWVWELEQFPARWLSSFDYYQEIWTPSAFCQDSISRQSPIPVLRIPYPIQVDVPLSMSRLDFGIEPSEFVFLAAFDMLSVFERKNPLAAIEAFVREFGNSPSCRLVLKINHAEARPEHLDRLRNASAGYPVTILDRTMTRDEVNALLNCCDCLISLHRSEGFGLALAEAMYLGKPVIATAYSGNMDFTKPDNSFLVGYRLQPVGSGCEPYDESAVWADPSVAEASAHMRAVYECADDRRRKALAGQDYVLRHLSMEAVGGEIRKRLEWIRARAVAAHNLNGPPSDQGTFATPTRIV